MIKINSLHLQPQQLTTMKVITFSRAFPAHHPRAGQPTHFVEKINKGLDPYKYKFVFGDETQKHFKKLGLEFNFDAYKACKPKLHTIRSGHNWNVGDIFSPRVWGDDVNPKSKRKGPYHSKQITIAPPIEITKIYDFKITPAIFYLDARSYDGETEGHFELLDLIAQNDGLERHDLVDWFKVHPKARNWEFEGQILCWGDVNYG